MEVRAKVPAKLILFGEHSVVHGKPALAAAISLYTTATATINPRASPPSVSLTLPLWTSPVAWRPADLCSKEQQKRPLQTHPESQTAASVNVLHQADLRPRRVFETMVSRVCRGSPPPSMSIVVRSDIPVGAGLGSSAALSVALAGALSEALGEHCDRTPESVNALALFGERVFHANPSGVDNTVCTYGGAVLFSKSEGVKFLTSCARLRILVADTGVSRSTRDAVLGVAKRYGDDPHGLGMAFDRIGEIAKEAANIISKPDGDANIAVLESLVDENHRLLRDVLGVGHESIDRVVSIAREFGLHAKITGAGCGGCVFAFVPSSFTLQMEQEVLERFRSKGFPGVFFTTLGSEGLTVVHPSRL